MNSRLLLYGATGYTGKLLARAAALRQMAPVLSGRSEEKLGRMASELDLEFRAAAVNDPQQLDEALEGIGVVVNAAGPFCVTASPLIDACLRSGAHYLDVTGEVAVIDMASRRDTEAKQRKIMIMPAVGFDVAPSDCLAAHVARRTESGRRLSIGISGLELLTRGSAKTIIEQLGEGAWVRRRGVLQRVPSGSLQRAFDYGSGPRSSVAVSWGDVASAYFTTGVPDITVYFEETSAIRAHNALLKVFGWAVPLTPWRQLLDLGTDWLPEGPTEQERARREAVIVAEVEGAGGMLVRSRLRTPEAFSLTASSATAIAARVIKGDLEPGFQTPARVYGADLILKLPGVTREDLL